MNRIREKEEIQNSIIEGISCFKGKPKDEAIKEGIAEFGVGDVNEFLTKIYSHPSISLNFSLFLLKLLTPFSNYPMQDLKIHYNEELNQYELIVLDKPIRINT